MCYELDTTNNEVLGNIAKLLFFSAKKYDMTAKYDKLSKPLKSFFVDWFYLG
jgi:hypothetical protein